MRGSNLIVIVAMICGISILCALGGWQIQRLYWKEALIAQTHARIAQPPVSLDALEKIWAKSQDVDYYPATITGNFFEKSDVFYFNTLNGKTGWNVITPFKLSDGRIVLVNRGFVPDQIRKRDASVFAAQLVQQQITGLARNPIHLKPNSLMPDNQIAKREFYWKSYTQLAHLARSQDSNQVLPFLIDAGAADNPARYPKGGTTRISFPNNHLQYALTWFGLALALLAVGTLFLYDKIKKQISAASE